jgi:hypothetical protein
VLCAERQVTVWADAVERLHAPAQLRGLMVTSVAIT